MSFRSRGAAVLVSTAAPTQSVDIGDPFLTGGVGLAADAGHQHAVPAPGAGYVTDIGSLLIDGALSAPARADHAHRHRASDHEAGGFADLTGVFAGGDELVINVKRFGAVGDGVTDDAAAIQSCINLAFAAGGGFVYLPVGTYIVGALLNLKTGVHLVGAGTVASVVKLKDGVNPTSALGIIQPDGYPASNPAAGYYIHNASVRHLSIDGNKPNNAGGTYECLELSFTKNCFAFDVEAYNSRETGIHAQSSNAGTDQMGVPRVVSCVAHHCDADGFQFGGVIADDLYAYQNTDSGINVVGNYSGSTSAQVANVIAQVSNSRAENNTHTGVNVENQIGPDIKVQMHGIVSVGNGDFGFSITMAGFTGSRLDAYGNGADGFFIDGNHKTINGITARNNGQGSSNVNSQLSGVQLFGTINGLHLTDVRAFDDQTVKTQQYGIFVNAYTAGVIENVIDGANIAGNAAGAINSLAMTDYRLTNLCGITPVGLLSGVGVVPATPAVPASTVAYTNRFGYPCQVIITGGTVTAIVIAGATTGLTSGAFIVAPDQTISITYSVVPTWQWFGL